MLNGISVYVKCSRKAFIYEIYGKCRYQQIYENPFIPHNAFITSPFYNRIVYQGYISLMMIEICVFGYETFWMRARRIHFWVWILDCLPCFLSLYICVCLYACALSVCVRLLFQFPSLFSNGSGGDDGGSNSNENNNGIGTIFWMASLRSQLHHWRCSFSVHTYTTQQQSFCASHNIIKI